MQMQRMSYGITEQTQGTCRRLCPSPSRSIMLKTSPDPLQQILHGKMNKCGAMCCVWTDRYQSPRPPVT